MKNRLLIGGQPLRVAEASTLFKRVNTVVLCIAGASLLAGCATLCTREPPAGKDGCVYQFSDEQIMMLHRTPSEEIQSEASGKVSRPVTEDDAYEIWRKSCNYYVRWHQKSRRHEGIMTTIYDRQGQFVHFIYED
ncbi:hypothetical protein [Ottowia testudinis]|uniref:Uncharacterized protein n=1 Tax=Ottowia testudinis TaxID=2816950 RepID=A0A975CH71_9BURK|nr:hypothetical protein [Ottowia testudinis]QTD46325.1 hypothetical protein J1M35_05375 [Ottowia testudinis]